MRECHHLGMNSRTTADGYWPLVAFALAGIVGGAAGALLAGMGLDSWPFPEYHPAFAPARLLVASAAVVGGVLAGWFLAILVLSWAPGQSRCPSLPCKRGMIPLPRSRAPVYPPTMRLKSCN
jgi:hypothetical protein